MTLKKKMRAFIAEVLKEADNNPEFAKRLEIAIGIEPKAKSSKAGDKPKRSNRRSPGVLDPFEVFKAGEEVLRKRLLELDIEQLKDIVAENGMDRSKLAMKWKTQSRFIDLITDTVSTRSRKGDAFREMESPDQ